LAAMTIRFSSSPTSRIGILGRRRLIQTKARKKPRMKRPPKADFYGGGVRGRQVCDEQLREKAYQD
jgi:hypothetical protein